MQDKVKTPAIALLAVGAFGAVWTIVSIFLGGIINEWAGVGSSGGFSASAIWTVISTVISLAGCGLMVWGGLQMQKLESWGLCLAASIVAMLPCFGCCLVGLPIGIWVLVVLVNSEVKQAFAEGVPASDDGF
jgi:hypothetical protein